MLQHQTLLSITHLGLAPSSSNWLTNMLGALPRDAMDHATLAQLNDETYVRSTGTGNTLRLRQVEVGAAQHQKATALIDLRAVFVELVRGNNPRIGVYRHVS